MSSNNTNGETPLLVDNGTSKIHSLKVRIILSALVMTILILPTLGFTINNAFEKHIKVALENELIALSYGILAVTEVEDGSLVLPEQMLANQFNLIDSGLYGLYQPLTSNDNSSLDNQALWRSPSLLNAELSLAFKTPPLGQSVFYERQAQQRKFFVYSFAVSFATAGADIPVVLHIVKDQQEFIATTSAFKQRLWFWLALLSVVLLTFQLLWLKWTLKPLAQLTSELHQVELGAVEQIESQYPIELQQMTDQLNTLLTTEKSQRQRYRNALSDLAHSLKTPLASIQSHPDVSKQIQAELSTINQMIEHQLKRAQSAGQSSWRLGIEIKPVAEKLVKALQKIYHQSAISCRLDIDDGVIFKGDEADLMEILGNLLDNAFKAATAEVLVQVIKRKDQLEISVSDDGIGIKDDQQQLILNRGVRADTYEQGHGIGLAIVRDLVDSYQGTLIISRCPQLAGAKFSLIF